VCNALFSGPLLQLILSLIREGQR